MRTSVRDLPGLSIRPAPPRARHWQSQVALAAAAELDYVSLPDALEIVLLLVEEPTRFRRAALRWHARYCGDLPDVGFGQPPAYLLSSAARLPSLWSSAIRAVLV